MVTQGMNNKVWTTGESVYYLSTWHTWVSLSFNYREKADCQC